VVGNHQTLEILAHDVRRLTTMPDESSPGRSSWNGIQGRQRVADVTKELPCSRNELLSLLEGGSRMIPGLTGTGL